MSSEVSIAKPLSGSECLEACLTRLRESLGKDDRFQSHMAYSGFRAIIEFKFYPQLSFIPPVEKDVVVAERGQEGIEAEPTVDVTIDIPLAPPNQVREEAGMPTPVLVTDGEGRSTEKWVQRGPKPFGKAPRNKVSGGGQ